MTSKQQAIASCILPRDARVPSDLAEMDRLSPIEHSFASFGGNALNRLKADYIQSMIVDSLGTNLSR